MGREGRVRGRRSISFRVPKLKWTGEGRSKGEGKGGEQSIRKQTTTEYWRVKAASLSFHPGKGEKENWRGRRERRESRDHCPLDRNAAPDLRVQRNQRAAGQKIRKKIYKEEDSDGEKP